MSDKSETTENIKSQIEEKKSLLKELSTELEQKFQAFKDYVASSEYSPDIIVDFPQKMSELDAIAEKRRKAVMERIALEKLLK